MLASNHSRSAPDIRSLEVWYPGQQGASKTGPLHLYPLPAIMKFLGSIFLVLIPWRFLQPGECPSENSKTADISQKGKQISLGSWHVLSFQGFDFRFGSSESPRRVESPAARLHRETLETGFISSVRTWFIRSTGGQRGANWDFAHACEIQIWEETSWHQSESAGHLAGGRWQGGEWRRLWKFCLEWSALAPWGWARMNEMCFVLCWLPVPGVNDICHTRQGLSSFLVGVFVVPGLQSLNPAMPAPCKGWLVNIKCWVNLGGVVLFLVKCWLKIVFFHTYNWRSTRKLGFTERGPMRRKSNHLSEIWPLRNIH